MKPVIPRCLLVVLATGCASSGQRDARSLSELEAHLRADRIEVERQGFDRLDIGSTVPIDATLAWDRDGRRVAMATHEEVRIVDPEATSGPDVRVRLDPLPAPPRLFWLADGRLWVAPGEGGLQAPFEPVDPPTPRGTVLDVGPTGDVVLTELHGTRSYQVRDGDAWRAIPRAFDLYAGNASHMALLDDALFIAHWDGPLLFDADARQRLRWPDMHHVDGPVWRGTGRVCVDVTRKRVIVARPDALRAAPPLALLQPRPRRSHVVDGCVGPDGDHLVVNGKGASLHDAEGLRPLDPKALAAAADPSGTRLATLRRDGLYVGPLDGPLQRVADGPSRPVAAVAIADLDHTWVVSPDPEAAVALPGVETIQPVPENDTILNDPLGWHAAVRLGWQRRGNPFAVEVLSRVAPYTFTLDSDGDGPQTRHRLAPALQLSADGLADDEAGGAVNLRLALPLVYHRDRVLALDDQLYRVGRPLTVTLEPAYHFGREEVDLTLSVVDADLGGLYGRLGWGPEGYTAGVGVEVGRQPTTAIAATVLVVGGLIWLAQALKDSGCIHRCSEYGQ